MFKGRINRTTYILASTLLLIPCLIAYYSGLITESDTLTPAEMVILPIAILLFVYSIGVSMRRFHDLGLSGLFVLLIILPGVPLVLALIPSQKQTNKYGPPPNKPFDFSVLLRPKD